MDLLDQPADAAMACKTSFKARVLRSMTTLIDIKRWSNNLATFRPVTEEVNINGAYGAELKIIADLWRNFTCVSCLLFDGIPFG